MCKRIDYDNDRDAEALALEGLRLVLDRFESQDALAQRMRITQGAVSHWLRRGGVPIERVPEVERLSGVPRWRIRPDRPDLFPPPASTDAPLASAQRALCTQVP